MRRNPVFLKERLREFDVRSGQKSSDRMTFGAPDIDRSLNGGLKRRGLHEFQLAGHADAATALGLTLGLAQRAADTRPIMLLQQHYMDSENGHIHAPGLVELGLDPTSFILFKARNNLELLRASLEAARCEGLGAVIVALSAKTQHDWLTATRKFNLAAETSGVPVLLLHLMGSPEASAAATRWRVAACKSVALTCDAPGHMHSTLTLLRQRGGAFGFTWNVEWTRDTKSFSSINTRKINTQRTTLPRGLVSLSPNRSPSPEPAEAWQRHAS